MMFLKVSLHSGIPAPSRGGVALPWRPVLRKYSVYIIAEKIQSNWSKPSWSHIPLCRQGIQSLCSLSLSSFCSFIAYPPTSFPGVSPYSVTSMGDAPTGLRMAKSWARGTDMLSAGMTRDTASSCWAKSLYSRGNWEDNRPHRLTASWSSARRRGALWPASEKRAGCWAWWVGPSCRGQRFGF